MRKEKLKTTHKQQLVNEMLKNNNLNKEELKILVFSIKITGIRQRVKKLVITTLGEDILGNINSKKITKILLFRNKKKKKLLRINKLRIRLLL